MWSKYLYNLFEKENTDKKLLKNIEIYEQKKREKQSQGSDLKRDKLHRQKNEKIQK
jgi:hypothetical protein